MSLVKRWRGLGHQIRLTVLLTASSAIVLGALLLMTGYMLTKSVTDSAQRQMHNSITARFIRERDWTVNDILDWNHLQRVREKEFQSGVFPPPRVRRAEGSTRGPRRHAVQRGGVRQPGAPESPTRGSAATSPPDSQPPSTPRAPNSQAPPDPALRNHMFQALYTNDGQPYPKFIPAEISVDRAVGWPKTLADASKLPTTFRHTVVNDPKGRFKVLCIFDVTEQLGELAGFKAALLALYPILVVIFALATYVGIGRSFQPLHKLLGQASTLGLHDRMETADQAEFGEL